MGSTGKPCAAGRSRTIVASNATIIRLLVDHEAKQDDISAEKSNVPRDSQRKYMLMQYVLGACFYMLTSKSIYCYKQHLGDSAVSGK